MTDENKINAFLIMPFKDELQPTFDTLKSLCEDLNIDLARGDTIFKDGLIINQIYEAIQSANIVLADFSENNPNVMYEIGYSHAFKKPTILLIKEEYFKTVPFDISAFRYVKYVDNDELYEKTEKFLSNFTESEMLKISISSSDSDESFIGKVLSFVNTNYGGNFSLDFFDKNQDSTHVLKFYNKFDRVKVLVDSNGVILKSATY